MKEKDPRECPACNSRERRLIGEKNGFEIFVCADCSTLYTGHVPAADETENYDEYYSESNLTVPEFVRTRVSEIVSGFSKYRRTGNFLDIGFGAGTVLDIASEQGWKVSGLEVSKPAVDRARMRGFDVFHGGLSDAGYAAGQFDVITSSEILEHLPDPIGDLKEIARILRPGGLFWATTPSARSLSFRLLKLEWSVLSPPEHIQLYSRRGASLMLESAGFSSVKFKTFGINSAEISDHYRSRKGDNQPFNRVEAAYKLNESLTRSPIRKLVKGGLNEALSVLGIGDSLKIYAKTK